MAFRLVYDNQGEAELAKLEESQAAKPEATNVQVSEVAKSNGATIDLSNSKLFAPIQSNGFQLGEYFIEYVNKDNQGKPFFGERRVEISLGQGFLNLHHDSTVVEVGSTMFNWREDNRSHTVIDLHDTSDPRIINKDAAEYDYTGKNVLSISTIEHFDDVQVEGVWRTGVQMSNKGFETIKRICSTANHYLLTFPVGIHSKLDQALLASDKNLIRRFILKRDEHNNWSTEPNPDNFNYAYDKPYPCANAIHVITNLAGLHRR